MSDQEMSLHAAILGGGEEGYRVGRMIEGLLMAQVALALDRFRGARPAGGGAGGTRRARTGRGRQRGRDGQGAGRGVGVPADTPMDWILPWRILEFQHKPN